MDGLQLTEVVLGCLVLGVCALLVLTFLRRRLIAAGAAMFLCAFRPGETGVWRYGLARFDLDALVVYPALGVGLRPRLRVDRADMQIGAGPRPYVSETPTMVEDPVLVSLRVHGEAWDLVVPRASSTALSSWHEARPPGRPPSSV